MVPIIFKIVICSSLFLGLYYLFLERERTFKFNRFFLLIALLFSYVVPFLTFTIPLKEKLEAQLIFGDAIQEYAPISISNSVGNELGSDQLLVVLYTIITTFFLLKFIYSFSKIKFLKGEERIVSNQRILIIDRKVVPFSFLNTIYISREHLVNNEIEEQIFLHEHCHIKDKHSFDLLFIEFLKMFTWFNPALFFYKKAMIANHEFMADDYVLQNKFELKTYQTLILNKINISQNFNLTHQFNFNNTKKRFIMMTTKNSKFAALKKFALLPVIGISFLFFSKKMEAQNEPVTTQIPTISESKEVSVPTPGGEILEKRIGNFLPALSDIEKPILKKDTIKNKTAQEVINPTSPPPPPPPSEFTQIPAEFPGGANALRRLIADAFDTSIFSGDEGLIKSTLYVSIDEIGNVSNVYAEGENKIFTAEAERAFKAANVNNVWRPATENGQGVKTVYKIPLFMKFESNSTAK